MSDDTTTNSCTNLSYTNWYDINLLVEWKYKIIEINHVGQEIFSSTNELTSHQFVQTYDYIITLQNKM